MYLAEVLLSSFPCVAHFGVRATIVLGEMGYDYHNPLHEKWDETRTDCEANVAGSLKAKMTITEVVKPIVRQTDGGGKKIIQKAIVVVE